MGVLLIISSPVLGRASVGHDLSNRAERPAAGHRTPTRAKTGCAVITRSDCVTDGYWQNPEVNAETLRGGWLHTGDLGSMDEDGLLTLRDRSKDMIISGGSNIYPREIEEVLLRHPGLVRPQWLAGRIRTGVRRLLPFLCSVRAPRSRRQNSTPSASIASPVSSARAITASS